jgi:hypothetical protein
VALRPERSANLAPASPAQSLTATADGLQRQANFVMEKRFVVFAFQLVLAVFGPKATADYFVTSIR